MPTDSLQMMVYSFQYVYVIHLMSHSIYKKALCEAEDDVIITDGHNFSTVSTTVEKNPSTFIKFKR